jgi:hypothetical protein
MAAASHRVGGWSSPKGDEAGISEQIGAHHAPSRATSSATQRAYTTSSPISCARSIASLREDTPSLRYTDMAWLFTVFGDR